MGSPTEKHLFLFDEKANNGDHAEHTAGSAHICGKETLNMKPELKDETYPLFGKVSVPRMILAQFDSINHRKLLQRYGQKVLRDLEVFIFRNQSVLWWPIYLTVFILLHEASKMSADRYRHARNNFGGRVRNPLSDRLGISPCSTY